MEKVLRYKMGVVLTGEENAVVLAGDALAEWFEDKMLKPLNTLGLRVSSVSGVLDSVGFRGEVWGRVIGFENNLPVVMLEYSLWEQDLRVVVRCEREDILVDSSRHRFLVTIEGGEVAEVFLKLVCPVVVGEENGS